MDDRSTITKRVLTNTQDLIKLYNTNPRFRELFDQYLPNPRATYKNIPLKVYVRAITLISPKYRRYDKEVRENPQVFKELLTNYYHDLSEYGKFQSSVQNIASAQHIPLFSSEEQRLLNEIEQTSAPEIKTRLAESLHQHLDQRITSAQNNQPSLENSSNNVASSITDTTSQESRLPSEELSVIHFPSFIKAQVSRLQLSTWQTPSFIKNMVTNLQIKVKRFISGSPVEIAGGLAGAIAGAQLGPPGIIGGAVIGVLGGRVFRNQILTRSSAAETPATPLNTGRISGGESPSRNRESVMIPHPQETEDASYPPTFENSSNKTKTLLGRGFGSLGWLRLGPIVAGVFITIGVLAIFHILLSGEGGGGGSGKETAAPLSGSTGNLGYTIPFRDSNIEVADSASVKNKIKSSWPNAKLENWDTIVNKSRENNWNPAFVLALWIEETGAQGASSYDDALGCDPQHPTTDIDISLKCLFNSFSLQEYPNDKFADLLCMYSESKKAPCNFVTNPNFPGNLKYWYSQLVPSGPGAITIPTLTPLTQIADASCPIPGGKIGCGSYGPPESWGGFTNSCRPDSTGNGGHCNQNYKTAVGICGSVFQNGNLIRTAKSVDIASPTTKGGDSIFLPEINGRKLKWKYVGAVSAGRDFGYIRLFQTEGATEGIWSLHFVHVNRDFPGVKEGDIIDSGTAGAAILNPWIPGDNWPHAHVTIGLNVGDFITDLKDFSPNWKFADRELGLCIK